MGKVFLDMAVSLDGFVSGPNGEDGGLHDWYFAPSGNATLILDELLHGVGAMVLGKRAFGDQPDGFDTPYKVPHFVLSHAAKDTVERDGATFSFVTDGVESALEQAKAAGDKDVCVAGGANVAQQCLKAGLLDEVQLHLVPVLFGGGLRLFDHLGGQRIELERTRVLESPGVTHLKFRVVK
ncbi:MAG: Dihydrofolate reductase [uncultured Truepera sp.]|uniref:Dihydrofolate reductase n=1 Tax=uncultured Truepera sp. TaxID=543023 RepID=A0A6J4UWZ9_9DEIN|nr:MAG: Dihydrofolate reductase [uncultured Truepera sp.]